MKNKSNSRWISWGKPIITGLVIAFIVRSFFFSSYIVEGSSMTPTLQEGNLLIINKFGYQYGEITRFDVIVFHANKKEDYVKRVIGLPGDELSYQNGKLFINGTLVEEPFLKVYGKTFEGDRLTENFTLLDKTGKEIVPKGKLFVIGDNRLGSYDSRHFGFIDIDQVVGKVNLRYFPFEEMDTKF
jgi:signal peptidase I